jgi:hypothetical protein
MTGMYNFATTFCETGHRKILSSTPELRICRDDWSSRSYELRRLACLICSAA